MVNKIIFFTTYTLSATYTVSRLGSWYPTSALNNSPDFLLSSHPIVTICHIREDKLSKSNKNLMGFPTICIETAIETNVRIIKSYEKLQRWSTDC